MADSFDFSQMMQKNSGVEALEFDAPIPGQSWSDDEGKWPWDRPARLTDPKEAVKYVIEQIEKDEPSMNEMKKLMLAGIPIEQIVHTITFAGFTNGEWSVDCAELIKAPIARYLIDLAGDSNIPATVFSEATFNRKTQEQGMEQGVMYKLMRQNRPDMFENISRGIDAELARVLKEEQEQQGDLADALPDKKKEKSFLTIEEE